MRKKMNDLNKYRRIYLNELEKLKTVVSEYRYDWLQSVSKTDNLLKIQTAIGYVIALREHNYNIGDTKLYLEYIRDEINKSEY